MGTLEDLGLFLRQSGEGVMRGVRSVNDTIGMVQPTTGASLILPGAGIVEGNEDFRRGLQGLQGGDYGQGAIDYARGALNVGTEALPAVVGGIARRGLRATRKGDDAIRAVESLITPRASPELPGPAPHPSAGGGSLDVPAGMPAPVDAPVGNARNKGAQKYAPGTPEQLAMAQGATFEKNAATAVDPRWQPPDDPMFWPWRVDVGGYQTKIDPKKGGKAFPERVSSPGEKELQKILARATKEVKAGEGTVELFPLDQHVQQPQRNEVLPLEERAKGIPEHVRANVAPGSGAEERLMESANRAPEEAAKWYWTGNYYNDLAAIHGPEKAQDRLDRFGAYMGATTSDAAPPANVRMATYQMALADQIREAKEAVVPAAGRNVTRGDNYPKNPVVSVPVNPQYPYGHARYSGTHRPILERLTDSPYIDSVINPKGAEFAGSISGQSNKAVLDRVMMEDVLQAKDAKGNLLQTPEPGTYGVYRDWMDEVAARNNIAPDTLQAQGWVGHNPEKFDEYKRTLQQHIGDRVNITAKVMSAKAGREVTSQEVYEGHLRHGWPLLALPAAVGGLGVLGGMGQPKDKKREGPDA